MTPESAASAYVNGTDALNFIDARVIGDAIGDQGIRVTVAAIPTHPVWLALLDAAAGEIEAAIHAGERYRPADLTALLAVTPPATTVNVSGRKLQALNAGIATGMALERRQPVGPMPDLVKRCADQLDRLRKGEWIFGFVETAEAGSGPNRMDPTDPRNKPGLSCTDRRYFGVRTKYKQTANCWGGGDCGCGGGCGC